MIATFQPKEESKTSSSKSFSGAGLTLRGKRVLISVVSVGMGQFHHLETQLDSYRDLCEAGSQTDIHIYTDNVYSVNIVDQLNSRLRCRNTDGGTLNVAVHIKSGNWKYHFMDFHRVLFYDNLDNYDVFIHNEDDHLLRPMHIISFLDEIEKLKKMVGDEVCFLGFEMKISF